MVSFRENALILRIVPGLGPSTTLSFQCFFLYTDPKSLFLQRKRREGESISKKQETSSQGEELPRAYQGTDPAGLLSVSQRDLLA